MKYCLYASREWLVQSYGLSPALQSPIKPSNMPLVMHSGLTNWPIALNGVYDTPLEDTLGQYDVIHVNVAQHGIGYLYRLRKMINCLPGNKPLLVANVDPSIDMWEGSFERITDLLNVLPLADRLFCVHPVMCSTLSTLLKRKVWHIPHPSNIPAIKSCRRERHTDGKLLLVYSHAYDANIHMITELVHQLKQERDGLVVALIGRHTDKNHARIAEVYDETKQYVPFANNFTLISMADVIIDTAKTYSYGRIAVESAILETPCVTGDNVWAGFLLHNAYGSIFDMEYIKHQVVRALDTKWEFGDTNLFSYDTCKQLFEEMINANE